MRFLKIFLSIISFFFIVFIGLVFSGNTHLLKAIKSTYLTGKTGPTILDYSKFKNDTIFAQSNEKWLELDNKLKLTPDEESKVKFWETTSLILIKEKKIIYEKYWDGFNKNSLSNSFSMAKSFTSIAIGCAIKEGKIKSLSQPVYEILPEFDTPNKRAITIEHLLSMSSGIDFGESYGDPFGFMAKTYYGKELYELTMGKPVNIPPGLEFHYQGGNTLLLSFIIEKVTGKSLSEYFSEKVWVPIGAQNNALWSITENDKKTRSYCCFYSNARDYARIGQLYLDSGVWNGQKIISRSFYENSIKPINLINNEGDNINYYGLHWWLGEHEQMKFFYARGILGQYIVVVPEKKVVLVRLGHKRDKKRNVKIPSDLFVYLDLVKKL